MMATDAKTVRAALAEAKRVSATHTSVARAVYKNPAVFDQQMGPLRQQWNALLPKLRTIFGETSRLRWITQGLNRQLDGSPESIFQPLNEQFVWLIMELKQELESTRNSAKAAAVVAAAKAVGVKASPDTRHRIAYIATRIRSDIQNGYINIDLASILRALTAENAKGQPPTSNAALARDLAGDLYKLAMWQTGNQMRDLPGKTAEYARGYLVRIIRAVQKDGIPA